MAKKGGSEYGEKARGFLEEEISHHVKDKGMPQDQAVAAAMSEARRKGLRVPRDTEGRKEAPKKSGGTKKGGRKMTRSEAASKAGKASARARRKKKR
jgi:hypothetical protein